jgi:hypothetical protein
MGAGLQSGGGFKMSNIIENHYCPAKWSGEQLKALTGEGILEMKGVIDLKSSHESSPFKIKELEVRNNSFWV